MFDIVKKKIFLLYGDTMKQITKIALSGGPSGGKSFALKKLIPELLKYGYSVYPVFESAEEILNNGFNRGTSPYEFQKAIAENQIKSESEIEKAVKDNEKAVIICDRGLMDCRVYLNDEDYEKIKKDLNMSEVDLRDRYDAVFHLDSTSSSEIAEYANSKIRVEAEHEAREINERSKRAWCGNPHYRFIPVCESFSEKLNILLNELKAFLGIPKPLEIERKFLIEYPDTEYLLTLPCAKVHIEQHYLIGANGRYRLRKRGENGGYIYIKTVKKKISETVREEIEERISENEYNDLLKNDAVMGSISKDRYCLMYNGTYYEIDIFPFWKKQAYLEVELLSEDEEIVIPEFINVIKEVTFDERYKNSRLCNSVPDEEI